MRGVWELAKEVVLVVKGDNNVAEDNYQTTSYPCLSTSTNYIAYTNAIVLKYMPQMMPHSQSVIAFTNQKITQLKLIH